jgi:hypothetical protein
MVQQLPVLTFPRDRSLVAAVTVVTTVRRPFVVCHSMLP